MIRSASASELRDRETDRARGLRVHDLCAFALMICAPAG
jgi:hypothetical protein